MRQPERSTFPTTFDPPALLLRPPPAATASLVLEPGYSSADFLWSQLRAHGRGCLAYTGLNSGLQHFATADGYVTYQSFRHRVLARKPINIVLGDPVAAPAALPRLIEDFLHNAPTTVFLQVSEACARVLDTMGLTVNRFGIETDITLPTFDLKGKLKSHLRHWINTARKHGIVVTEQELMSTDMAEVTALSSAWLKRKGGKELALLTRPFAYRAQPDVRFFAARRDGELLAMATFDPLYDNGHVFGYYQDIVRCKSGAPHGTSDLLTVTAIEQFRSEGLQLLATGLSPLSTLDAEPFRASGVITRLLRLMHDHANFVYAFKGLEFHKKRYRGVERPVFVASTNTGSCAVLRDLIAIILALKVF